MNKKRDDKLKEDYISYVIKQKAEDKYYKPFMEWLYSRGVSNDFKNSNGI